MLVRRTVHILPTEPMTQSCHLCTTVVDHWPIGIIEVVSLPYCLLFSKEKVNVKRKCQKYKEIFLQLQY